jgi:hypothetical protein
VEAYQEDTYAAYMEAYMLPEGLEAPSQASLAIPPSGQTINPEEKMRPPTGGWYP